MLSTLSSRRAPASRQMCEVTNLGLLKVSLQDPWQHFLQHSLGFQALILLAPEGEAASEHAVQQDAT